MKTAAETLFFVIGVALFSTPLLAQNVSNASSAESKIVATNRPGSGLGFGPGNNAATQADHKKMLELLGIKSIRPGRNGGNTNSPNAANYDEAKANPFPNLPDPLTLKNGDKVTTPEMWWNKRRPEIVEDFDREIYGRVPRVTPKVNWELISTTCETNGGVPVRHSMTRQPSA